MNYAVRFQLNERVDAVAKISSSTSEGLIAPASDSGLHQVLVQAAFGSADGQDLCNYDLDCDGQINPVDSGIVQSLFGTCEQPRDGCP